MPRHLSPGERALLLQFRRQLATRLGDRLTEVTLFGSRARGEGRGDSDLDVLVAVIDIGVDERRQLIDLAADLGVSSGLVLSPTIVDTARFDRTSVFAQNVAREGVHL